MTQLLYTLNTIDPKELTTQQRIQAITALENGKILFFPTLTFDTSLFFKTHLWSIDLLDKTHKNVSYHYLTKQLGKLKQPQPDETIKQLLCSVMHQYAEFAQNTIKQI